MSFDNLNSGRGIRRETGPPKQYGTIKPLDESEHVSSSAYQERGSVQTLILMMLILYNIICLYLEIRTTNNLPRISNDPFVQQTATTIATTPFILLALAQVASITCLIGLWNWRKWGYYGLIAAIAAQMLLANYITFQLCITTSAMELVVVVGLMYGKSHMLD